MARSRWRGADSPRPRRREIATLRSPLRAPLAPPRAPWSRPRALRFHRWGLARALLVSVVSRCVASCETLGAAARDPTRWRRRQAVHEAARNSGGCVRARREAPQPRRSVHPRALPPPPRSHPHWRGSLEPTALPRPRHKTPAGS